MRTLLLAMALWGAGACAAPRVLSAYGSMRGANGLPRAAPHAGVDYAGSLGEPVLAAADGVVLAFSAPWQACGIGVLVAHPGAGYTLYCHLSAISVSLGEAVRRGQALGAMGTSGDSGGVPHVHLELCETPCAGGHRDGALAGTLDPLASSAGCYREGRRYDEARLALTHPIRCR